MCIFAGAIHQAGDRGGGGIVRLAAVVRIVGRHVMIIRLECDMAVTHAELRVPALGEAPAALQVLIKAVDGVDLVTALCAAYAEVGADEILVTLTMLAQVVVAQARNDRPRSEERRVGKGWVSKCKTRWSPVH